MVVFIDKAKERFQNALFGTPTVDYGAENQAYLNELAKQPEFQNLAQRNNLTLDQALAGVMQGRNYGDKNIAQRQQELGINIPQNQEEVALADRGLLNNYITRQGGMFNDLASGFKENYTQGFNVDNLQPQNKSFATKLGEGVGTLARFYDKPVGRGLLAGAIGLALGGGAGGALAAGLATGVGRQTNMTRDRVYRNQLKQMGMSEDEVNSIPGIVTDDIFKNYTLAAYRNNMTNYRNLKLDKDTYIKQQQNIYKMLNDGVITAEEATRQMQLLNDEYQKQNPMDMQESNKTVQGNRRLDIMENQGNERIAQGWMRLDLLRQKIENGEATEDEKEEYYDLRQRKLQLEIEELEEEKERRNRRGRRNKNIAVSTNKGGTTKNGVKYEVLN